MTFPSAQQLGQTKIRNLGIEVIINQYIAGLNVSVHHLWFNGLMQVGKTAKRTIMSNENWTDVNVYKYIDLRLSCAKENLYASLPS